MNIYEELNTAQKSTVGTLQKNYLNKQKKQVEHIHKYEMAKQQYKEDFKNTDQF